MIIDIERLEQVGYDIIVKQHQGGEIKAIHIIGTRLTGTVEAMVHTLHADFPRVDQHILESIAHRMVTEAQGHDIVRICAQD